MALALVILAAAACASPTATEEPPRPHPRAPRFRRSLTAPTPNLRLFQLTPTPIPTVTPETEADADPNTRLGIKETPNPDGLPIGSEIGYLAPDFRLETEEGDVVVLSDFRGRPVFINFFAVWCGPCRFEMPEIESIYNSLGDDLVVLTVDVRESSERVKAYKELLGLTMPTVMDTHRQVATAYQVPGLPWTYILDDKGVVRHIKFGAFLSREEIIAALGTVGITEDADSG